MNWEGQAGSGYSLNGIPSRLFFFGNNEKGHETSQSGWTVAVFLSVTSNTCQDHYGYISLSLQPWMSRVINNTLVLDQMTAASTSITPMKNRCGWEGWEVTKDMSRDVPFTRNASSCLPWASSLIFHPKCQSFLCPKGFKYTLQHGDRVWSLLPSVVTDLHYEPRSLIIKLATKGPWGATGKCMNSERIAAKCLGNRK